MRILLAHPRGYCAGVEMAINSLEVALQRYGAPLYVYHQIVHNTYLVDQFTARGVVFVESVDDVPAGATLMYSAHGVAPDVRKAARAQQLNTIDATCPLVSKVHGEAIRYARKGYTILLIGHQGHDEIVGVMGEAPYAIKLVQSVADVETLEVSEPERIAYLTQTTLSVAEKQHIEAALLRRFPHIEQPRTEDICYATQNRQFAVRELAPEAQLVVIIGSQHSSNSRRLADVAHEHGTPSRMIDGPEELQRHWFDDVGTVLLTAGASVPEVLVEETVAWLEQRFPVTIEERFVADESQLFHLPVELRRSRETANYQSLTHLQELEKLTAT